MYTGHRFTGRNAVTVRPADTAQVVSGDTWARDRSSKTADDGTELDATWANRVKAVLERAVVLLDAASLAAGDDQLGNAILAALAGKIGPGDLVALLADGDGFVRMTDAERSKLAALTLAFRGVYVDLAALTTAVPAGAAGDWAVLTHGAGSGSTLAVWDSDDTPAAWVDTGETGSIPAHGHAIAEVSGLQAALDAKAALAHTHAQGDIIGLVAALAALAPLASPTGSGTATWPTLDATTALKKSGVAGQIVVKRTSQSWTTGASTASGTEVDLWTSSEIIKQSAQADAATAVFDVAALLRATRGAQSAVANFTLYVRTWDGSAWGGWAAVPIRQSAGFLIGGSGATTVTPYANGKWSGEVDLTGKTKWQLKITGVNSITGSTPVAYLDEVAVYGVELL